MFRIAFAAAALHALAMAAAGQGLSLENAQPTMGMHGPRRADAAYLPGDSVVWRFDIAGLAADAEGRVRFSVVTQVTAADGKPAFLDQQDIGPLGNPLGGGRFRHAVQAATGLDQPAGEYTLKVTVTDRGAKGAPEAKLERKFTVKKGEFGLVRPQVTADPLGKLPAAPVGMVGQTLYCNVVAVGFEADKSQAANLTVELSVQDERGQPALGKAILAEFRDLPKETKYLPLRLDLPLTRAGTFRVTLKATDLTTKKTASVTLPLRAMEEQGP